MKFFMKKISTQTLLCLSIAAISGQVMAADSTINIEGQVITNGCILNIDDLNVVIPDISASDLAVTGSQSPTKSFTIRFEDCASSIQGASLSLGASGADPAPGQGSYLANTGTAKNVDVQIAGNSGVTVAPGAYFMTVLTVDPTTHSGIQKFTTYIRNNGQGAATPGTVLANGELLYAFR